MILHPKSERSRRDKQKRALPNLKNFEIRPKPVARLRQTIRRHETAIQPEQVGLRNWTIVSVTFAPTAVSPMPEA
jgi:membrane glycosyltransferase